MVIAPPGVLLRSPVGQVPLSRNGWREARWPPDGDGYVLIDQARPDALRLGQVWKTSSHGLQASSAGSRRWLSGNCGS